MLLVQQGVVRATARRAHALLRNVVVSSAALSAAGVALATENFGLRYAPGTGGGDMTLPVDPGLYLQIPTYAYKGKYKGSVTEVSQTAGELFTGQLASLASTFPNATAQTPVRIDTTVDVKALLPRLTYMDTEEWLGATVGATAMLPLFKKRMAVQVNAGTTVIENIDASQLSTLTGGTVTQDTLTAAAHSGITATADAQGTEASGQRTGVGDLELGAVFRWNEGDQQVLFVPTIVLPTGNYDKQRAVNAGAGKFYTFRPTLQFGQVFDHWDIGGRASFSINTKSQDTSYRSGNYLNLDLALMHSLSDELRVGAAGYAMLQTTRDRFDGASDGKQPLAAPRRDRVFGLGPNLSWLQGTGDWFVDARWVKEFGAVDRPEGNTFMVMVALPLR